jgi:hypothetical protein
MRCIRVEPPKISDRDIILEILADRDCRQHQGLPMETLAAVASDIDRALAVRHAQVAPRPGCRIELDADEFFMYGQIRQRFQIASINRLLDLIGNAFVSGEDAEG